MENYAEIQNLIADYENTEETEQLQKFKYITNRSYLKTGPTIFHGDFQINTDQIYDTYFDPAGWGKVMQED